MVTGESTGEIGVGGQIVRGGSDESSCPACRFLALLVRGPDRGGVKYGDRASRGGVEGAVEGDAGESG